MSNVSATDAEVIRLERQHPKWQVWTVSTWNGNDRGTIWCARRHDNHRAVLNAHSAQHLAEAIIEAELED